MLNVVYFRGVGPMIFSFHQGEVTTYLKEFKYFLVEPVAQKTVSKVELFAGLFTDRLYEILYQKVLDKKIFFSKYDHVRRKLRI